MHVVLAVEAVESAEHKEEVVAFALTGCSGRPPLSCLVLLAVPLVAVGWR